MRFKHKFKQRLMAFAVERFYLRFYFNRDKLGAINKPLAVPLQIDFYQIEIIINFQTDKKSGKGKIYYVKTSFYFRKRHRGASR